MSRRFSIARIRKVGSALVAFVLLFSMFANAFPTPTPDCCSDGKMCPIHHTMPAKAEENSHMDCQHEGMGLQPCSMSCGDSHDQGVQTTAVFLLPDDRTSATLIPVEQAPLRDVAVCSDLTIRPLTPPPRFPASL
jgi:hypothetical protein